MIKLKDILNETLLVESGIRDIKKLAKAHKEADLYFHQDLDGVTTAIAMKNYLERYGIKVVRTQIIQYGGREYAVDKPLEGKLAVIVDFAHGKPLIHIHTDHHDFQSGVSGDTSVSFKKSPSNVVTLSQTVSPSDIFPSSDVDLITIVDSADYARTGIEVDRVLQTAFSFDKTKELLKSRQDMGLVVNKVLLAFKNKPGFMEEIVMKANPSLISIYTVMMKVIKERGLKYEDLEKMSQTYIGSQSPEKKMKNVKTPKDIKDLGNGEYGIVGNTMVQYGGGYMMKGGYDRYTPFKNNPGVHYLILGWPMGLVQVSKNPFMTGENPYDLGKMGREVIDVFKDYLQRNMVSFLYLKKVFEEDIEKKGSKESFGFTSRDLAALFGDTVQGLPAEKEKEMFDVVANKQYMDLTDEEKDILSKVKVSAYDIVTKQSGGHRNITNVSGLNCLGKGYVEFVKAVMIEFVKRLKDKSLQ